MHLFRLVVRWFASRPFVRFGVRNRFARAFHHPDGPSKGPFEVPFHGLRYAGDFGSFIDWSVFYFGAYSAGELALIDACARAGARGVALDVGANVGHHTLFLATRFGAVRAFEPVAALARQIEARLAANGLRNVTVCNFGLGEKTEELPFFASDDANAGTGTFVPGYFDRSATTIQVRQGDEALAGFDDCAIDFIKIDVEGFEPFVLAGLSRTLRRDRPVLFFEWSSKSGSKAAGRDPSDCLPPNYRLFEFREEITRWIFFTRGKFGLRPWRAQSDFDGNLFAVPEEGLHRFNGVLAEGGLG